QFIHHFDVLFFCLFVSFYSSHQFSVLFCVATNNLVRITMWGWLTGSSEQPEGEACEAEKVEEPEEGAGTPECPSPKTREEYEATLEEAKGKFLEAIANENWRDL